MSQNPDSFFENQRPCHPSVENRADKSERGRMKQQVASCQHEDCDREVKFVVMEGKPKTFKQFKAAAQTKGWTFDHSAGMFFCPDHKPAKIEEDPMAKTDETLPKAGTAPREMSLAERRLIFREIDDSYEDSNSRYVSGITDKTIADKLKVPWAWVAQIREDNFGPAGPDPKLKELINRLEETEKKALKALNDSLSAAEKAEAVAAEAKAIRDEVMHALLAGG